MLTSHPFNNVTENIFAKIGANLHRRPDHPICIIKEAIYAFFDERCPGVFTKFDDLHPVVSARAVGLLNLSSLLLYPHIHFAWYFLCQTVHALVNGAPHAP